MNRYASWVYMTVIAVMLIAGFLALPNLFGESLAVQITREQGTEVPLDMDASIKKTLDDAGIAYRDVYWDQGKMLATFDDAETQLRGKGAISESLDALPFNDFQVALNFASNSPSWLRKLNMRPVHQGLDLRGGVYLLFEVDMNSAIEQAMEGYVADFKALARDNDVPRITVGRSGDTIRVAARESAADRDTMEGLINDLSSQFVMVKEVNAEGQAGLAIKMSEAQIEERKTFAIEQNTTTMRSRLNQLGVAEPIVQRQGANRIVVQLPGVQEPSRIIGTLSVVATLEWRGECQVGSAIEAARLGRPPAGCLLYEDEVGNPVLLNREVIATGNQLKNATSSAATQDGPAVSIDLDAVAAKRMLRHTQANVNKRMGVVFIETTSEINEETGKREINNSDRIISLATIRGVFSNRFQITGLNITEAQDLAILLRAGALAAPVYVVEERTVGPTLGQDNIARGKLAIQIGFLLVVIFMLVYYKMFGLFANFALLANVVIIVGVLSLLQASLTLPGIAGIVLTVGMAVDANVLIFERIREEINNGNSPQAAIHAGYDKAFSSIADANVTTLIAALVLWLFGTGPIRGFAVTLSIGIASSMFTAIIGTRALVNWIYGGRRIQKLSI
ncbi:MAG: protein translocase subunit SecD [Gammaproteobacteria bacterium]